MSCHRTSTTALIAAALLLTFVTGCSLVEKAPPQPRPSNVTTATLDVPQIMRGTIASETTILGYPQAGNWAYANVVVRGYGLVVGLTGTGSREVPPALMAHMRAEAAKGGIGTERSGWGHLNIDEMLRSIDTAIVVVEGVIPPGATEHELFDVRVYADPRTGTTSLEGGRLYTTALRPGELRVGGAQAFPLAEARGPVFINPFAEPGAVGRDTVKRTVGRILNGGDVVKNMPLKLRLVNPSHVRAQRVQTVINTRFPQERGQHDPTAMGESDELISLNIPPSYHGRTDEFIALVQHTTLRMSNPLSVANSIKRSVTSNPAFAPAAALRWQALGQPVLPVVRELYDYPEELPRLAAISAGARLNDGMVTPHLTSMSRSGSIRARLQAIDMLAAMQINPRIDGALRALVNDPDVDIRLAAYEALVERRDPWLRRFPIDDKFVLDLVPSEYPLIYITQRGDPRLVIFGDDPVVKQPLTMSAWSGRLMIKGDADESTIEIYYRPIDAVQGEISTVKPMLAELLVAFLGHTTTVEAPAPGLGLNFGETVGVLHQIWTQGYVPADFKADQDQVLAQINQRESQADVAERPEFSTSESRWFTPGVAGTPDETTGTPERPELGGVDLDNQVGIQSDTSGSAQPN